VASGDIARLRHHAEHCRRLAKSFKDAQAVAALGLTAAEYDDEADKLEQQTPEDQSSPV
jgi:hypothetical protein